MKKGYVLLFVIWTMVIIMLVLQIMLKNMDNRIIESNYILDSADRTAIEISLLNYSIAKLEERKEEMDSKKKYSNFKENIEINGNKCRIELEDCYRVPSLKFNNMDIKENRKNFIEIGKFNPAFSSYSKLEELCKEYGMNEDKIYKLTTVIKNMPEYNEQFFNDKDIEKAYQTNKFSEKEIYLLKNNISFSEKYNINQLNEEELKEILNQHYKENKLNIKSIEKEIGEGGISSISRLTERGVIDKEEEVNLSKIFGVRTYYNLVSITTPKGKSCYILRKEDKDSYQVLGYRKE